MNGSAPLVSALIISLAVFFGAMAAGWWWIVRMPGSSHRGPLAPLTPAQQAAAARLEADVRMLAGTIGERSIWSPLRLEQAAQHIESALAGAGLHTRAEAFASDGEPVRNIEATLAGAARADEIVVVGAHYDSVRGTVGANDNGSGVAALLELARRLAGERPARSLRFVAFVNEEPPFFNIGEMGSQFYARAARGRGERIVAMLSLETIGYYSDARGSQRYPFPFSWIYPDTGDFVAFVGNLASGALVRDSVRAFRRSVRFPSQGVAAPAAIPGVAWSDHGSFWEQGYPGLMVTDTAPFRYPWYHTTADTPDRLDYPRMARVLDGLAGVVRALASPP